MEMHSASPPPPASLGSTGGCSRLVTTLIAWLVETGAGFTVDTSYLTCLCAATTRWSVGEQVADLYYQATRFKVPVLRPTQKAVIFSVTFADVVAESTQALLVAKQPIAHEFRKQ